MKNSLPIRLLAVLLIATSFIACKDKQPQFTVKGEILGADSTTVYLIERTLSEAKLIDSVTLNTDGKFSFTHNAPAHPELYLLKLDRQAINFSIDSTETIEIKAQKDAFATNYDIVGNESVKGIKQTTLAVYKLNKEIRDYAQLVSASKSDKEKEILGSKLSAAIHMFKEENKTIIVSDYGSMAAYYALFAQIEGLMVYETGIKSDMQLFRAVATAMEWRMPNSPRAEHLKNYTLRAIAEDKKTTKNNKMLEELLNNKLDYTATVNMDISLRDQKGVEKKLSELRGKVVILDFTAYQTEYSPAHNMLLNNVYRTMGEQIEIYQVSLDSDAHAWKNTANNLPWICVRDGKSLDSELMPRFNVQGLPTMFLVDKKGTIAKRIGAKDDIIKELNKLK